MDILIQCTDVAGLTAKNADGKFTDLRSVPKPFEPGSKLLVLGMVIQPLIGNPYNGYINPYYWVDDHPRLYGNNGSLDPSTFHTIVIIVT